MSPQQDTQTGEQSRCELPDNIVGIGNAGKQVLYHYLSQEWILEEGFAARNEDRNPQGFNAYIIDTATDEQGDDERAVDRINRHIERVAEESGRQSEVVQAGINSGARYINPLDHATDDLISRAGLTSEATVGRIASQADISSWWLENDDSMLTNGYDEGVLRRRGLSKALLHASQTGSGSMEQLPRELSTGSTTIVVGIGGGTGSGMFLDLAKQIDAEGGNVNLIATIPGLGEKDRKLANAYAVLSELEYLALNEHNPFQNIILVPFGPARELRNKDTFLDGVVQTIVARENTTNDFEEFLDESMPNPLPYLYAPFTVAIPQILRYDVGDIQQTADAIDTYREQKRAALDIELRLYTQLYEFLTEEWENDEVGELLERADDGLPVTNEQFTLSGEEASALVNRFEKLKSWVQDDEQFGAVDNEAMEDWRELLEEWSKQLEHRASDVSSKEYKRKVVTELPARAEKLDTAEDKYPGEDDAQKLHRVFRDELRAIKLRSNIRKALKLVDREAVTDAIEGALKEDKWAYTDRLDEQIATVDDDVRRCDTNLSLLDDLETELEPAIERRKKQWREAVEDDIDLLVALEEHEGEIKSELEELKAQLDDAFTTITNAHEPDQISRNAGFSFDFVRLNDRLRSVGVDPVDGEAIQRTVERTIDAHRAWHKINSGGFLGGLLGGGDDAKTDYLKYLDDLDAQYVDIQPTGDQDDFDRDFACEFVAGDHFDRIFEEIESRREERIDEVVHRFRVALTEADPSDTVADYRAQWVGDGFDLSWPGDVSEEIERFERRLSDELDARSAEEVLDRLDDDGSGFDDAGVVYEAFETALVSPIETKREELEETTATAADRRETYDRLRQIVTHAGESFNGTGPTRPEMEDVPMVSKDESPYVHKTHSIGQESLTQYSDISESEIWQDADSPEMQKIVRLFTQFANDVAMNKPIVGLDKRRIEVETGTGTSEYSDVKNPLYEGHYVGNVFMGRTFRDEENPSDPVSKQVKQTLKDSNLFFQANGNGFTQETKPFGAPWDISMTTFIGGVFLDNLRAVQAGEGYKHCYESQRDELRENVRIRHTHAVDGRDAICGDNEGAFVYRDRLLDLNDPDDRYTLLNSTENEMAEQLLNDFVDWERFPSAIDLTRKE